MRRIASSTHLVAPFRNRPARVGGSVRAGLRGFGLAVRVGPAADGFEDADALLQLAAHLPTALQHARGDLLPAGHPQEPGSEFPVEISVTYIRLDRDYLLAVESDVTERTRVERALIESHVLLNAVVEGTSDVVFVKDLSGCYLMINSAGARFLHRRVEEVIGRVDRDPFPPETADAIMERDRSVMASGESQTLEEIVTEDGPADAIRHAAWACHLAMLWGEDEAVTITSNHEDPNPESSEDKAKKEMDMANNATGARIGARARPQDGNCVRAAQMLITVENCR